MEAAARSDGNLLAATVEAMRVRATVGEVSDCLRAVFAEYDGNPSLVRGVYGAELADDPQVKTLIARVTAMDSAPRLYMAKLGQDGHDRGSRVIASAFLDFGYDVQTSPLFQTPEEAAQQAIAANAQVVGVSSLAAGHKTLAAGADRSPAGTRWAGGYDRHLRRGDPRARITPSSRHAGVAAIFGPGTNVIDAGAAVLDLVTGKIGATPEAERALQRPQRQPWMPPERSGPARTTCAALGAACRAEPGLQTNSAWLQRVHAPEGATCGAEGRQTAGQ